MGRREGNRIEQREVLDGSADTTGHCEAQWPFRIIPSWTKGAGLCIPASDPSLDAGSLKEA